MAERVLHISFVIRPQTNEIGQLSPISQPAHQSFDCLGRPIRPVGSGTLGVNLSVSDENSGMLSPLVKHIRGQHCFLCIPQSNPRVRQRGLTLSAESHRADKAYLSGI